MRQRTRETLFFGSDLILDAESTNSFIFFFDSVTALILEFLTNKVHAEMTYSILEHPWWQKI